MGEAPRFTVEDIERAYAFFAWAVMRHGDVYIPLLDRMERELQAAQHKEDHRKRCERILATYTRDGGMKAIR